MYHWNKLIFSFWCSCSLSLLCHNIYPILVIHLFLFQCLWFQRLRCECRSKTFKAFSCLSMFGIGFLKTNYHLVVILYCIAVHVIRIPYMLLFLSTQSSISIPNKIVKKGLKNALSPLFLKLALQICYSFVSCTTWMVLDRPSLFTCG